MLFSSLTTVMQSTCEQEKKFQKIQKQKQLYCFVEANLANNFSFYFSLQLFIVTGRPFFLKTCLQQTNEDLFTTNKPCLQQTNIMKPAIILKPRIVFV